MDQGTEEHYRGSSTEFGHRQGGDSAGGGSSGSRRKQRRRWLVPAAQCSGDASLAGAWLEEAQGSAVQAGPNQGSATGEPGLGYWRTRARLLENQGSAIGEPGFG